MNLKSDKKASTTINVCQVCETAQVSNKKCSNESCNLDDSYIQPPSVYTWFNIRQQFEQIMGREKNIVKTTIDDTGMSSTMIKNILDGRLYKHLKRNETSEDKINLFTLSLSSNNVLENI